MLYKNPKELINKTWNLFCVAIFQYHKEKCFNLPVQEEYTYRDSLTELERNIYNTIESHCIPDLDLALHKDFPKVWNKFIKMNNQ